MPLVRIDLIKGKPAEYCRGIGDVVYQAMIEVLKVPKDDRFQVIAEHPERSLIADENYLGIKRTQDCVFIQNTLNAGRSTEQKKSFYRAVQAAMDQIDPLPPAAEGRRRSRFSAQHTTCPPAQ